MSQVTLHEPRREHCEIATTVAGDSALGREFSGDDEVDDPAEQDRIATELPS